MKIILSILIIFLISTSFANPDPIVIDGYLYKINNTVSTPDTSLAINILSSTIIGGQVDVFLYQYPLYNGSDATSDAQVKIETSLPNIGKKFGRTSFSVDAAIYGFGMQIYDGIDSVVGNGNPCGGVTTHLDDIACENPVGIHSPGLQLDFSTKEFFVTEILSLDIPFGVNIIVRVWDNSGNSGYMNYINPGTVIQPADTTAPYKPLLFFPFKSFSNSSNIDWTNIRAFAIEYNSTAASADLVMGPLQALGTYTTKSSSNPQPVEANSIVKFNISIVPDFYDTNFISQLLDPISYDVIINDTLPAEFIGFNESTFSIVDQFGYKIPFNYTINGNNAIFTLSFDNGLIPSLTYDAFLPTNYSFCSKNVCNTAELNIRTSSGIMETIKNSTAKGCVLLKSPTPITVSYSQCPTYFNNTLIYDATVCNKGKGLATNATFFHTSSDSLSNCVLTFPPADCVGASCTYSVGDLPADTCVSIPFSYDCSSYSQSCVALTFSSSIYANETCSGSSFSDNCTITLEPNTSTIALSNTFPSDIVPNSLSTKLVSQVCNNGLGSARNVVFNHIGSGSLSNCIISSPNGTCNGLNCVIELGLLFPNQCEIVEVDYNCSSYLNTCSPDVFPATIFVSDTCNGQSPDQSFSFNFNIGTPNVTITNTCPHDITPENRNTSLISQVCNQGSGYAQNVVFNNSASGSLTSCTAYLVNGTCSGSDCSINLGILAPNQCVDIQIDYDCSSFTNTCSFTQFPSTSSAIEGCGNPITSQTCSFNLDPGSPVVSLLPQPSSNLSPSNTLTNLLTQICNQGPGTAQNVIFNHTPGDALTSCTANLENGTCNGAECSINLGNIPAGSCVNVSIDFNCSSYADTCTLQNFTSTLSATEGCNNPIPDQSSFFILDPGTANVVITNTCPDKLTLSSTNGSVFSNVCNRGNGTAQNVVFKFIPINAMEGCNYNLINGTCDSTGCSINLGNMEVGQCFDLQTDFDCSSFNTTCSAQNFFTRYTINDKCETTVQPSNCSFNLDPGVAQIVTTSPICPPNLSENSTNINHTVKVCNSGNGFARNVVFTQTALDSLSQCVVYFPTGSCSGNTCTQNLGTIAPLDCQDVNISYDCSAFAKTCSIRNFIAVYNATESCSNTNSSGAHCTVNFNPGVSKIQTSLLTCPDFDSDLQTNSVSSVCNVGTGVARNVVFTHTLNEILSQCIPTISTGSCNSGVCTSNLGDFQPNQCQNITVHYNCSSLLGSCTIQPFIATSNVTESCSSTSQQNTCVFSINSNYTVYVSESLLSNQPVRTNQIISWNITASNFGALPITNSYVLSKSYPQYTQPTPSTLSLWSCDQTSLVCNYTGNNLATGQSISLLFEVQVLSTIPLSTTQLCNSVYMSTPLDTPNCYATSTTQSCSLVEPNTPDLVLRKRVATTQYTFKINYSNLGSSAANNLVLSETLQSGWSLDSSLSSPGWSCTGSSCSQTISSVPSALSGGNTGSSLFVVNVDPSSQTVNGSLQCWSNFVNSTYDEIQFDPTPENNYANSPSIGSYCQKCCEPVPCPPANCTLVCPPTNLVVDCPDITCQCEVPQLFCPPCENKAPACNCNQCPTSTGIQFA